MTTFHIISHSGHLINLPFTTYPQLGEGIQALQAPVMTQLGEGIQALQAPAMTQLGEGIQAL